jgi:putative spermidine/putrescine transport system substrate-binding protein
MKFRSMTSAAAILGLAVGLAYSPAVAQEALTVVSWGGAYTQSQIKAYHEPFTAETGTTINSADYSGGLAEIKAQVEAGNVTWDLVDVELSDAIRGCDEGLLETIDPSILPAAPDGTPALEDFIEGAVTECAVANIVWSTIYAYDSTVFPNNPPTTMEDFFNLADFPGKRGMRKSPKANLEMALMADGVAPEDVYDVLETAEGVDRAFAKLDTIKGEVVWWEAGAQPPQLLADGEVAMTMAYNGRIFNAVATENKPFVIVWDGQIFDLDLWVIPKGTANLQAALDFVAFSTATEQLAAQASYISYGPARNSSNALVGDHATAGIAMAPHMPTAPANFQRVVQNDFEFWADNQDQLNERFNAWLASN